MVPTSVFIPPKPERAVTRQETRTLSPIGSARGDELSGDDNQSNKNIKLEQPDAQTSTVETASSASFSFGFGFAPDDFFGGQCPTPSPSPEPIVEPSVGYYNVERDGYEHITIDEFTEMLQEIASSSECPTFLTGWGDDPPNDVGSILSPRARAILDQHDRGELTFLTGDDPPYDAMYTLSSDARAILDQHDRGELTFVTGDDPPYDAMYTLSSDARAIIDQLDPPEFAWHDYREFCRDHVENSGETVRTYNVVAGYQDNAEWEGVPMALGTEANSISLDLLFDHLDDWHF